MRTSRLIFVYNADSGIAKAVLDSLHKTFSPDTYSCQLCQITYGAFTMRKEWRAFIAKLPIESTFLHRDEWRTQYGRQDVLPAIFLDSGEKIRLLVDRDKLQSLDLNALMSHLREKLKEVDIS